MLKSITNQCRECGFCVAEKATRWNPSELWCAVDGYQLTRGAFPWELDNMLCLFKPRRGPRAPQVDGMPDDYRSGLDAAKMPHPKSLKETQISRWMKRRKES